jgi:hypothetical protein
MYRPDLWEDSESTSSVVTGPHLSRSCGNGVRFESLPASFPAEASLVAVHEASMSTPSCRSRLGWSTSTLVCPPEAGGEPSLASTRYPSRVPGRAAEALRSFMRLPCWRVPLTEARWRAAREALPALGGRGRLTRAGGPFRPFL